MPWSYSIDTNRGVIFTKATGTITEADLVAETRAVYQDPEFRSDLNVFHDYSEVADLILSCEFLAAMAENRRFSKNSKTAIWAPGPLSYGLGHIFQVYAHHGSVVVFHDRNEALAWLNEGVPPEKAIT